MYIVSILFAPELHREMMFSNLVMLHLYIESKNSYKLITGKNARYHRLHGALILFTSVRLGKSSSFSVAISLT